MKTKKLEFNIHFHVSNFVRSCCIMVLSRVSCRKFSAPFSEYRKALHCRRGVLLVVWIELLMWIENDEFFLVEGVYLRQRHIAYSLKHPTPKQTRLWIEPRRDSKERWSKQSMAAVILSSSRNGITMGRREKYNNFCLFSLFHGKNPYSQKQNST